MKTLLIYAIALIVLPSFTQAEKIRIKPVDFVQFRTIAEKKSFKHSFTQKNQYAHEKKVYSWERFSSNWDLNLRTEFEFSTEGLIKKEVLYDAQNQAYTQYIRKYDEKSRMILEEEYSMINNEWQIMSANENQYDAQGRELLQEHRIFRDNEWVIQFGIKQVYDSLNTNTSTITQYVYDLSLNQYIANRKEIREYENGRLTSIINQIIENNSWKNEWAESYDYNDQNIISSILTVVWEETKWLNHELIYNIKWENYAEQMPAEYFSKTWANAQWENERKTIYTYTSNGGVIAVEQLFNDGFWKNQYRFIDEFDSNKNRSLLKIESFENNDWVVQFENQYVHIYDNQQRLVETITRMFDGFSWMNVMKEEYGQYKVGTGILSNHKLNVQVFPNPFTEYIQFTIDEKSGTASVNILDLSGRILMVQNIELSANNSIQVSEIPLGYYILRVEVEGKVYTEKIVKKGE